MTLANLVDTWEHVEKQGSRLVVKVGRALAHVRRSQILLSTRDLVELKALLGVVDHRPKQDPDVGGPVPRFDKRQIPFPKSEATVQPSSRRTLMAIESAACAQAEVRTMDQQLASGAAVTLLAKKVRPLRAGNHGAS